MGKLVIVAILKDEEFSGRGTTGNQSYLLPRYKEVRDGR